MTVSPREALYFLSKSVGLCFIAFSVLANDAMPERVVWDKRPIALHIERGHERIVHFPEQIRYWLPDNVQQSLTAIAANGVLYLQAHQVFAATRIRVQGLSSHNVYLLDVNADEVSSVSDELFIMDAESGVNQLQVIEEQKSEDDWTVRLTRYAAQQLYAPERVLRGDPQIIRMAIDTSKPIALIKGGQVKAKAIAAWKGGGLFITAVKIQNQTDTALALTFSDSITASQLNLSRAIRGRWLTVTPQHASLGVQGHEDDTTVLYLSSERPLAESLVSFGGANGG